MNDRIPCSASAAELAHDRPSASAAYWPRALDQIVEALLSGQYPESGRPSLRLVDLIDDEVIFSTWLDMVIQDRPEPQAQEVQRVRARLEEILRDKLANDYRVGLLAGDMERDAKCEED